MTGAAAAGIVAVAFGFVGCWTPECGHSYLASGNGRIYFLRSLPGGSYLCVYDSEGKTLLGEYPTPGEHSCHITLLEHQAVVCDYTSGTLSLYSLDDDGLPVEAPSVMRFSGCGPDPVRQASPHIHSSWVSPDGGSLIVADLGSDKLYRFAIQDGRIDADSREDFSAPSGSGPRHCAFNPDGSHLYVSTELSDEVLVYSYPDMSLVQRVEVNPLHPRGGGHVALSPDGRFLYASSRLQGDGIAVFVVGSDGLLTKAGYTFTGSHPRHFAISSDGLRLMVACRDSGTIETYAIDPSTGLLSPQSDTIRVEKPVFVLSDFPDNTRTGTPRKSGGGPKGRGTI